MKTRTSCAAVIIAAAATSAVQGLTPPSSSDGPVKLLACVVTSSGILEASVESATDQRMRCHIRCAYLLGGRTLNHSFDEFIPARFQGRVGRFDTSSGTPGSYPGDIGRCEAVER